MPGACCCCREGCKAGRQEALIGEYRSYLALFFFFPGGGVSSRASYLGPGEMSAVLAVAVHPQYPLGFILGRALGCVPLHPAPPPPKSWLCLSRAEALVFLGSSSPAALGSALLKHGRCQHGAQQSWRRTFPSTPVTTARFGSSQLALILN